MQQGQENGTGKNTQPKENKAWQRFVAGCKASFPPDGYDFQEGLTYPNIPTEIKDDTSQLGMYLAAFIGFPSRPKAFLNAKGQVVPHLTFWQFLKGFIGGLDWAENTSSQKKFLQIFPGLLIKVGIILPFKFATWPLKLAVNITKLLLEISTLISSSIYYSVKFATILLDTASLMLPSFIAWLPYLISLIVSFINTVVYAIIGLAIICAYIIAIFALSPLETMKTLYNLIDLPIVSEIFALISLMISATLWAIAIPILFSIAIALFPVLTSAIAFVTHIPLIASLLAATSGTFLGLSASVGTFFVSYSAYWAGLLGVTLSSSIISVASAATIGFFAALIAVPSCYIADALSDRWAAWHKGSLWNALFGPAPKSYRIITDTVEKSTTEASYSAYETSTIHSNHADGLNQRKQRATKKAFNAGDAASARAFEVDDDWTPGQTTGGKSNTGSEAKGTSRVEVLDESSNDESNTHDLN